MELQGSVKLREMLRSVESGGPLYTIASKAITELGTMEEKNKQLEELVEELETRVAFLEWYFNF